MLLGHGVSIEGDSTHFFKGAPLPRWHKNHIAYRLTFLVGIVQSETGKAPSFL